MEAGPSNGFSCTVDKKTKTKIQVKDGQLVFISFNKAFVHALLTIFLFFIASVINLKNFISFFIVSNI